MILDEQRLAVTRDTAARITGLSRRRLDHWARTDFLAPSTDDQLTPGRRIRFYDFLDLLGLMVAAQLIERGVPLPHIRQIVSHLRARGYAQPLAQLTWATHGKRVYFQHPDGSREGDLRPGRQFCRRC
ncbi:MAG: MerR family transcriptional regulator [Pseudonocardiaceae bacterium]